MRISTLVCAGIFGLLVQTTANAQIYESTDAEGVPEFSDTPSMGAEVVDLPATNTVEAPPEEPAAARSAPGPAQAGAAGAGSNTVLVEEEGADGVYYTGGADDDDVRAQRRVDEDRIDNALPGGPGPGVGNPDPGYGKPGPGVEHHAPGAHR